MKKFVTGLCAALLLFTMCGCSDATTNVSNRSEALITIGNDKITNGDVYSGLIAQGDVSAVASALSKAIASKAVETTEAIEKSAQASLDALKTNNKDWDAYLAKNNYKDEKELLIEFTRGFIYHYLLDRGIHPYVFYNTGFPFLAKSFV